MQQTIHTPTPTPTPNAHPHNMHIVHTHLHRKYIQKYTHTAIPMHTLPASYPALVLAHSTNTGVFKHHHANNEILSNAELPFVMFDLLAWPRTAVVFSLSVRLSVHSVSNRYEYSCLRLCVPLCIHYYYDVGSFGHIIVQLTKDNNMSRSTELVRSYVFAGLLGTSI